jgi:DNA-binding PadR family transcriptional regulator
MRADFVRGHLDLLLLAVVEARPSFGYAIVAELRRKSDNAFDVPEGTIYPALHRLERAGLLRSSWQTISGRRRRVYRLTRKGRVALGGRRDEWSALASAVAAVLKTAT